MHNLLKSTKTQIIATSWMSVIWYIVWGVSLYACQPSWDPHYAFTWWAIAALIVPVVAFICTLVYQYKECAEDDGYDTMIGFMMIALLTIIGLALIVGVGTSFGSNMYRANANYRNAEKHITVVKSEDTTKVFPELIKDGDTSNLPLYGQEEAYKKASSALAKETALGTQIKVNKNSFMSQELDGSLVYTAETKPTGFFKRNADLQYYTIDRNAGKTMAYSAKDFEYANGKYFSHNTERYLKKQYPRTQISDITLEIDNDGNPMYVASVLEKTVTFGKFDIVKGVIVLNPKNGEHKFYSLDKVPTWVDRIYPEEVLLQYITAYGKYAGGFWNGSFAQKGVLEPTTVHDTNTEDDLQMVTGTSEVVYIDGEPFLWTGMNSAKADNSADSNGIMLASLKTGEITYYQTSGVSELHAVEVAQGLVQEKGYSAGYPIPLEISGVPSMFMLLRDKDQNTVGYAMVSYEDYTKSAWATNVSDLVTKYLAAVGKDAENSASFSDKDLVTTNGAVEAIASEVVDGRTVYYIVVDKKMFSTTSKINAKVVFLKVGDKVEITYADTEASVIPIKDLKI